MIVKHLNCQAITLTGRTLGACLFVGISLLLLSSDVFGEEIELINVGFTSKPSAKKEKNGVAISFGVSKATDVEIAILDAQGKIIRHLAAGLLGPNAPHPFKKNSLSQSIIWDRKDDDGRPVKGALNARVRIAMRPKLDRIIAPSSSRSGPITALGVAASGELYVLSNHGKAGGVSLYALDRKGRYLRTIFPSPANLKPEQVKGLERIAPDGYPVPVVYQAGTMHLAPFLSGIRPQQLALTSKAMIRDAFLKC